MESPLEIAGNGLELRFVGLGTLGVEAMVHMVVDQGALGIGNGTFYSLKLLSDIDAGLTVLNHSDDRAEMAFGTFQPGNHLAVACVGVFICHRVTLSSPGG